MFLADTLSRAYLPIVGTREEKKKVLIFCDARSPTEMEAEHVNKLHYLPVKEKTLSETQASTPDDEERKLLTDTIRAGWQARNKSLFESVTIFPSKEELVLHDGVISRVDRVAIPFGMREEIKRKLYTNH